VGREQRLQDPAAWVGSRALDPRVGARSPISALDLVDVISDAVERFRYRTSECPIASSAY
jgi:hypothetical protein